jgi:type III restriction enzyme
VETTAELKGLSIDEVKDYFEKKKGFHHLPIGKKKAGPIKYEERHLFTDEVVTKMKVDVGLLSNAWSAAGYFAQELGRVCRVSNPHSILTPVIEEFISKILFEREVDLYAGDVDHRMRDIDVMEYIRATFTPLILNKIVRKTQRRRISQGQNLSLWKPYQATSNDKRPSVQARKTMFNLVPCENEFERAFVDFCDYASDVVASAKNAGPQKLMIDYMKPDGHRALYVPDFFIRNSENSYYLVELKGKVDNLVPVKVRAAVEWCKTASKGKVKWRFLYIPYHLFQQSATSTIEELSRACEPSLRGLIEEAKTGQQELPLFEETAQKEAEELFSRVLREAGIQNAPSAVEGQMRQAIILLDHAVRSGMPEYGHAFQPLLHPFDDYALRILDKQITPKIPTSQQDRENYFNPDIDTLKTKDRIQLEKYSRYLRDNLVFGRSIMKLGTLLFCLADL